MFALADENSKTLKREDAAVAEAQQGVMVANNTKRKKQRCCLCLSIILQCSCITIRMFQQKLKVYMLLLYETIIGRIAGGY